MRTALRACVPRMYYTRESMLSGRCTLCYRWIHLHNIFPRPHENSKSIRPSIGKREAGVFKKSPLWRAFLKRCVFGDRFHPIHVDDRPNGGKNFRFKIKTDTPRRAWGRGLSFIGKKRKNTGCTSNRRSLAQFFLGELRFFSQSPASLTKAALRMYFINFLILVSLEWNSCISLS